MSDPIIAHTFAIPLGTLHIGSFSLGPILITGFGLAMMSAFGMAHFVAQHVLAARDDDPEVMNDVTFAALVGTIVGAKIYYAILKGSFHELWGRSGFVFWGGFIGAVTACALTIRYKKQQFLRIADACAVGIGAGYAIGRTGCWAVGDDYGRVYSGPLSVAFPEGLPPTYAGVMNSEFHANLPATVAPSTLMGVYPTQLLEVTLGFVMFAVLWRLRRHEHSAGWLFGVYCILAGIERFIVEFFRAKNDMIGPITSAQVVAVCVCLAGIMLVSWRSPAAAPRLASAR